MHDVRNRYKTEAMDLDEWEDAPDGGNASPDQVVGSVNNRSFQESTELLPDDWSDQSTTGLPEDRVGYGPPPDVQPPESEEEKEESDVPVIPR